MGLQFNSFCISVLRDRWCVWQSYFLCSIWLVGCNTKVGFNSARRQREVQVAVQFVCISIFRDGMVCLGVASSITIEVPVGWFYQRHQQWPCLSAFHFF